MGVRKLETSVIIWSADMSGNDKNMAQAAQPQPTAELTSLFGADLLYDAGDKGCAFGPLDEIAKLMRGLQSGQTLEVRATDPTVDVDLPAWCRMTGNTLDERREDRYLIRRK